MTRNAGNFVENQFVKGLVTEATGLNFPEQAVIESWNCRYKKTGEVVRRNGYAYENNDPLVPMTNIAGVRKTFVWKDVGNNGNTNFVVYQNGTVLRFFNKSTAGDISSGLKSFQINLRSYQSAEQMHDLGLKEVSFAYGDGKLFVAHPYCDTFYVEYDLASDSITATRIRIKIRDMEGVDDGLFVTAHPGSLSLPHMYNLWNQGWADKVYNKNKDNVYPDVYFYEKHNAWPSNADVWWIMRNADGRYDPNLNTQVTRGSSEAPKGHFILDAFNQDRDYAARSQTGRGIANMPIVSSGGFRPACVAFFAGRVWYAGVYANKFFNMVYYSSTITNERDFGKCYQQNDPTNENLSDILDTDGGTMKITGIGKITALYSTGNALLVFATNGIWSIAGSGINGAGFVSTDFSISKMSSTGLLQATSLIDADGTPIWWNADGIWTIQKSNMGEMSTISMSHETIKTFLEDYIPVQNRSFIQGAYNSLDRTIQWIYRSTSATNTQDQYNYDRVLELNIATGAFYPFKFTGKYFNTICCLNSTYTASRTTTNLTTAGGTAITVGGVAVTYNPQDNDVYSSESYKYTSTNTDSGTGIVVIEETNNDTWVDFVNTAYDSYFVSGAKVHGDGNKNITSEYLTIFCKDATGNGSVDQSAYIQGLWDWTNSTSSKKWSTAQQVYSARAYRDVQRRRLIIRGQGPALQMKIYSQAGKGFTILGWSAFESADASP